MKSLKPLAVLVLVGLSGVFVLYGVPVDEPGDPSVPVDSGSVSPPGMAPDRDAGPVAPTSPADEPEEPASAAPEEPLAQFEYPSSEGWDSVVDYSLDACDRFEAIALRKKCLLHAFDAFLDDGLIMDLAAGLELSE